MNDGIAPPGGDSQDVSTRAMIGSYGPWVIPSAGVLLALATLAGALGAHTLAGYLSANRLEVYDTAVRYQFYQSLGLLGMGVLLRGLNPDHLTATGRRVAQSGVSAARLLLIGIVLFCGSLYALSLGATLRWVGVATPIGGAMLIFGWLSFAYYTWRFRPERSSP